MLSILLAWSMAACDNSAAERLRTCAGGNTDACFRDGMAAVTAAKPRFGDARKALAAACYPSVRTPSAGSSITKQHPKACQELGMLVRDARGGPRDDVRAIELFEMACKDGIDRACVDLAALLYSDEKELLNQAVRAVVLLGGACNKVDIPTLQQLEYDLSANKDKPEAAELKQRILDMRGLAQACDALGHAFEMGIGVEPPEKNLDKSAALYLKSCDAAYPAGCVSAGNQAVKVKKKDDMVRGAELYERACRMDKRYGCFELAQLHENKALPDATDERAAFFYKESCEIDPSRGCFEAGLLMEEGKVPSREAEIDSLYNRACEYGNVDACARRVNSR